MTATTGDKAVAKSTRMTTYVVIGLTIVALLARRSRRKWHG